MRSVRKIILLVVCSALSIPSLIHAFTTLGEDSACCPIVTPSTVLSIAAITRHAERAVTAPHGSDLWNQTDGAPFEVIGAGPALWAVPDGLRGVSESSFPEAYSTVHYVATILKTDLSEFQFVMPSSTAWEESFPTENPGTYVYRSKFTGDKSGSGFLVSDGMFLVGSDEVGMAPMAIFLFSSGIAAVGWWWHTSSHRGRSKVGRVRRRSSRRRKSLNPGFFSNTRS